MDSVNTAKDVYHLQESLVLILFVVSLVLYLRIYGKFGLSFFEVK